MIGFLDCTSGISGDKLLGALVDAGASPEAVRAAVAAVDPSVRIEFGRVVRGGVAGLAVHVSAQSEPPHRSWLEVRGLIESAGLPARVAERALETFRLLAEAEAAVHDTTPDAVHFHEVGAIDSIADVVGAAAALDSLGIETLVCGPVALGSGSVETAHGTLPVPAPATALLLKGVPVEAGPAPGEATTPTGAALVRACATSFGPLPAMTLAAVGHGAGTRDTPGSPNVARVLLGTVTADVPDTSALATEAVTELETTLDHLSAEHVAFCAEELASAGALDVWQTPAVMKKGRAGTVFTVLAAPADETRLAALMAALTGTLGIRMRRIARYVVARESYTVETSFGPVRVKTAGEGTWRRVRAEYEDLAAIARRTGVPVDRVAREIAREIDDAAGSAT